MPLRRRQLLRLAGAAALAAPTRRFAYADDYPTRPVRIIEGLGGLRKDTAAALDTAKADLLLAEDKIIALIGWRKTAIEAGEDDRAIALEEDETKLRRRRELLRDRIALLQDKLVAEVRDRRIAEHEKAVADVTRRVMALASFDAKLANAITVVANCLEAKSIAMKMLLAEWPAVVERPLVSQVDLTNARDSIATAFSIFDRNKYGKWGDWTFERRLDHVRTTAKNFQADEQCGYDELISDIKASGPKPAEQEAAA